MAKKLLIAGLIIISIMALSVLLLEIFEPYIRYEAGGGRLWHCQSNLRNCGCAIKDYAEKNQDRLPLYSNWCDVFFDEIFISPKCFICPGAKNKSYSYALNKNVVGLDKIPDGVVILFDSKPGWNQVGGPELLAPENHGGKGCNILFGNLEVKFIEKEKFSELKWDIEVRIESAEKLRQLALAALMYADDHKGKFAADLNKLKPYLGKENLFEWIVENVEYIGQGKMTDVRRPHKRAVAYDRTLLGKGYGTNVAFMDGHVEFLRPEQLKKLGIEERKTAIRWCAN